MYELKDVQVRFDTKLALNVPHLELKAKQSVAVMGPNGSGKTTLLKILANIFVPSSGVIHSEVERVAYVAQHQLQHKFMPITTAEVLKTGRFGQVGMWRRFTKTDRVAIKEAAELLDVTGLENKQFSELSGGQRQRVLIATAVAQDAPVMLLDEPITGLDLASQATILNVIEQLAASGKLVVITTHHLQEANRCNKVLLVNTDLVACGTPQEVLIPEHLSTTFGMSAIETSETVQVFDDHGHGHDHDHGHHHGSH